MIGQEIDKYTSPFLSIYAISWDQIVIPIYIYTYCIRLQRNLSISRGLVPREPSISGVGNIAFWLVWNDACAVCIVIELQIDSIVLKGLILTNTPELKTK